MSQTRKGSLAEALINVLIGYGINLTANALIFPLFGWNISLQQKHHAGRLLHDHLHRAQLLHPPLVQ